MLADQARHVEACSMHGGGLETCCFRLLQPPLQRPFNKRPRISDAWLTSEDVTNRRLKINVQYSRRCVRPKLPTKTSCVAVADAGNADVDRS